MKQGKKTKKSTAQKRFAQGDLLYHVIHGVCRVKEILKQEQSGKSILCYCLVPVVTSYMNVRFVVAVDGIQSSGFHLLLTQKEANKVLDYLKSGEPIVYPVDAGEEVVSVSFAEENESWALAKTILSCSHEKSEIKDQRKRKALERSAKGLIGELAYVFQIPLKEAAERVRHCLECGSNVNPMVLSALVHATEE